MLCFNAVKPHIVPFSFGDEPLKAGSSASITCTVDEGDLPLAFQWIFHGHDISSQSSGIETVKIGKRSNILTIENIQQSHRGNYSCIVSNSVSSTNYTTELIIRG